MLVDQAMPVLERLAETLQKLRAVQEEQQKRVLSEIERAQAEARPVLEQVLRDFGKSMDRIRREIEAESGEAGSHESERDCRSRTP
jgi:phage-related protein